MQRANLEQGFTLIELAFVLIIFGLITTTVMTGFTLYNKQAIATKTDLALKNTDLALNEYVAIFGVYPCPADSTLGPGDPDYGREQRTGGLAPNNPGYDLQPCVFATTPILGKDGNKNGINDDVVLIGSVPSATITERIMQVTGGVIYTQFTDYDSTDGWGRKLTYAVTEALTRLDSFSSFNGAIGIVDENNVPLLRENELDDNGNGLLDPAEDDNGNGRFDFGRFPHFALISHGENGRGARMRNGTLVEPCVSGVIIPNPAPPGTAAVTEITNCNPTNGIFLSGLINESPFSYNDDIVKFSSYTDSALWRYTGLGKIENTNPGYVGIGTDKPAEMFHVAEEITANRVRAQFYTDRTGTPKILLPASALGGNGLAPESFAMQCGAGKVVTQIQGETIGNDAYGQPIIRPKVTCESPFGITPPPDMECTPPGYIMYGLENLPGGGVGLLCCDPTLPTGAGAPACP